METRAVINATRVNEFAIKPFAGGPGAFERVVAMARSAANGDILVLAGPGLSIPDEKLAADGLTVVRRQSWSMHAALEAMSSFAASAEAGTLVYYQADSPFVDAGLCATLLDLHRRYRAEYTFADGYPPGLAPEVLAAKSLPNLVELASRFDAPSDRDGLFAVIQKDINSYDIETHLSPVDLRGYRFSPVCDSMRNMMAAERLWALGARNADDVVATLPAHPELLRTVPAFLWVQICDGCPQACSYCPYPLMVGDPTNLHSSMGTERFEALMEQAQSLCDDLVVDVSLWGEPSRHPDFRGIVEAVLSRPRFTLIVETSGIGWESGLAESLASRGGARIQWIVSLDDEDQHRYEELRGGGQSEARSFAERLLAVSPGTVHVQAVRMRENEPGLETFYRSWKAKGATVIVQKYDSFAGCLPDRTVADLSPLERSPCRHLARDLSVLIDGSIPPCKHALVPGNAGTLAYAESMGNAFDEGLAAAWDRMGAWYERHLRADYPEPCGKCDEYHTFNA